MDRRRSGARRLPPRPPPRTRPTAEDRCGPGRAGAPLYLLDLFFPHEPRWTHGEDEENDEEGDAFLEIRIDDAEELLEEADDEASDEDADGILEPPEDRRREGLDAGHGAHVGPREGDGRDEDAAQSGQGRRDDEREHDHALDVDAHDGGRVSVEGDG